MIRPRAIVAVVIIGVGIMTVSGCTPETVPTHEWPDRMIALLHDPSGQGGAGGDLIVQSGAKSAHGVVELASIPAGEYDVLAVCSGTGIVHLAVKAPGSSSKVLASSDIACGATVRLPVTVAASGIVIEATNTGTPAQWQAALVTQGWEPALTSYSR